MKKSCLFIFLALIVSTSIPSAVLASSFDLSASQESFFPGSIKDWTPQDSAADDNQYRFKWKNTVGDEISLHYSKATPTTVSEIYQTLGTELDQIIKTSGGEIVVNNDFLVVVNDPESASVSSVHLLYATPDGAYLWTFRRSIIPQEEFERYIKTVVFTAREQQNKSITQTDNVVRGRWGSVTHEYAKLLADRKDPAAVTVYQNLLQTSPQDYAAQMEFAGIAVDQNAALQAAKIVARDAEDEDLLNTSAQLLKQPAPSISSYPVLSPKDAGFEVILIPLPPCNIWLLQDVAQTYEKITSIPVVIRQIPIFWHAPEPTRSVFRPTLEKMASHIWKTQADFNDWSLSKLKSELAEKAKEEGPQSVTSLNYLFKQMETAGYQWEADPITLWLSEGIRPYFSKDPHTMVVAVTELNIYSDNSNFVFSLYGGEIQSPVSVLSYAMMSAKLTGENQSRKRLTERMAKELVPASLKKLSIPRSTDPACPYSYANSLQRLDEKTFNLSDPVKQRIQEIKDQIK